MKGNLLQGTARGSLGDTVFFRSHGEQMARVRVRQISNPRSFPQLLNRVLLSTAGRAYALFRNVADHSFQNFNGPRANQAEFMRRNVKILQDQFSRSVENGEFRIIYNVDGSFSILEDETGNYNGKTDLYTLFNNYQISAGTLPPVDFNAPIASDSLMTINFPQVNPLPTAQAATFSYADYANALGVPVGSQLTIVIAYSTTGTAEELSNVEVFRIILTDSQGRTDTPMFAQSASNTYVLNSPNPQNIGSPIFNVADDDIQVQAPEWGDTPSGTNFMAAAVISSQLSGSTWMRSNAFLQTLETGGNLFHLGNAVTSYLGATESAALLNQARGGSMRESMV